MIYKLNFRLQTLDSLSVDLGKNASGNFLQLFSDTLHDLLNVYIQQKDKKQITVIRLNKFFERLATIENVDVARLNSISTFESELFYFKNSVYTIKHLTDTSGKQFYLNKHSLKSDLKNFDYEPKWQFPFERKNINSAHIFYADTNAVLLYVNVNGGNRFGQWILKVNAKTGKLIRGTKLNDKGETTSYQFGTFFMDTVKRTTTFLGQRFTQTQFEQQANKLSISNAPFISVYLIEIDSVGEVFSKQDFKIPVNEPKTVSKKVISNYLLRFCSLKKDKEGVFSFETDIYKNTDNTLCYLYANTTVYKLIPEGETLLLERNMVSTNQMIEKYYFNTDKMDINGKICIDSLSQFETFFYKTSNFKIKKYFVNTDNGQRWLLTRSDIKKKSINYSSLGPINKLYQLTVLDDILKSKDPSMYVLSSSQAIISSQEEENKFQLKLIIW
ncbi:MAG: hypothetical protein JNJ40_18030 [Bacteroidia bacterium]|nr:hypothetical protein [Bacteroidia bacterium]